VNIQMKGIYKSFGADYVLSDVDFNVPEGEICALLGESGAGKSTLLSILSGVLTADRGEITIDGAPVRFRKPSDAIKVGIAIVYQDKRPAKGLRVYEHMFMGKEISKKGILSNSFMISEAARSLSEIGSDTDPQAFMADLSECKRQAVDICRVFLSGASVIILDEAVEYLTDSAKGLVLDALVNYKNKGFGIVFASQSFNDAQRVSTRFTLLKDGAVAGEYSGDQALVDIERYYRGVTGSPFVKQEQYVSRYCVLKIKEHDLSFYVNRGEILGIAGSGCIELFMRVFGVVKPFSGKVYLHGKAVRIQSPLAAMQMGLAFAPRDRRNHSIFPDMNIMDNITMMTWHFVSNRGFINRGKQEKLFEAQAKEMRIKAGYRYNPASAVSGGSRQKALLARLLLFSPQVIIIDCPTQGMHTQDKEDIYKIICGLADRGASVILLSDKNSEIAGVCDRLLIMRHNRIEAELPGGKNVEAYT